MITEAKADFTCWLGVGHQFFHAGEDVVHYYALLVGLVQVLAEVFHFVGGGGSHLRLRVLQQVLEGGDQVCTGNIRTDGLLEVGKFVRHHVTHPPRSVTWCNKTK
jgi:hypothetical protein